MSRVLWSLQVLLAAVFAFAAFFKLASPDDVLALYIPLPTTFVRFIGVVETLGALGLLLPALLRIRPGLTPLAAGGLVIIMLGATVLTPTVMGQDVAASLPTLVLGVLCAFVAYGRARLAPIRSNPRQQRVYAQAN
jgi:DoxX-like family